MADVQARWGSVRDTHRYLEVEEEEEEEEKAEEFLENLDKLRRSQWIDGPSPEIAPRV